MKDLAYTYVVQMLREGKKIRRKSWMRDEYIWFDQSVGIVRCTISDTKDSVILNAIVLGDDWEIYDPPMKEITRDKALKLLAEGKIVYLKDGTEVFVSQYDSSAQITFRNRSRSTPPYPENIFKWLVSTEFYTKE